MAKPTRVAAQTLLLAALLFAFWIACVATLKLHEMIVGLLSMLFSTAFAIFAVRCLPVRFRPSLPDLIQGWRLPWYMVGGMAEIAWVLARDFAGRRAPSLFRSAPFTRNANNGADTAKRVLAISYTTVAPNFIVIGIDSERGQMLFHQVKASGVPKMTQALGARPEPQPGARDGAASQ